VVCISFLACNHSSSVKSDISDSIKIISRITVGDVKAEPALSLINFYKFYVKNNDTINNLENRMTFPNEYLNPNADSTQHVRVDFLFTEKYLNFIFKSGYVSEELQNDFRKRCKSSDSFFISNPIPPDVPPPGFDGDYFFGQIFPTKMNELLEDTIIRNEIKNDTGFVALKIYGGTKKLIKRNGKWQILPRE
jgi:hypothetical protein